VHQFDLLQYSLAKAEEELDSYEVWFSSVTFVAEAEIVKKIRDRPHMCGLLAASCGIPAPDLIKFELTLSGLFRTDLVLGNHQTRSFVLVEFEGAEEQSLFSNSERAKQYRSFARPLKHGFSQVVDWAWLKSDNPHATTLTNAFGGPIHNSAYLLVCGRDRGMLDDLERRRFEFRRHKTRVDGVSVLTLTYDGMVSALWRDLRVAKSFAQG
jgi:hypothetical protein